MGIYDDAAVGRQGFVRANWTRQTRHGLLRSRGLLEVKAASAEKELSAAKLLVPVFRVDERAAVEVERRPVSAVVHPPRVESHLQRAVREDRKPRIVGAVAPRDERRVEDASGADGDRAAPHQQPLPVFIRRGDFVVERKVSAIRLDVFCRDRTAAERVGGPGIADQVVRGDASRSHRDACGSATVERAVGRAVVVHEGGGAGRVGGIKRPVERRVVPDGVVGRAAPEVFGVGTCCNGGKRRRPCHQYHHLFVHFTLPY